MTRDEGKAKTVVLDNKIYRLSQKKQSAVTAPYFSKLSDNLTISICCIIFTTEKRIANLLLWCEAKKFPKFSKYLHEVVQNGFKNYLIIFSCLETVSSLYKWNSVTDTFSGNFAS